MADLVVLKAYRRFFATLEAVIAAEQAAVEAYNNRQTTVTITASQFEGGSSSGQISGDPRDVMENCQALIEELEAEAADETITTGPHHSDFSTRTIRT
jgi:hypothetical protein